LFQIIEQKQCLVALLGLCLWGALPSPTLAQVMDIRPDGSTVIYKGPVLASPEGIAPLARQPATARIAASATTSLPVATAIQGAARRHELSQELIAAVAWQESRMQQAAISPKGARGVMQLMPATARTLRVDPDDLSANVDGGATYLAQMMDRFQGDIIKSLAAYNAGPEAVTRYGGVPPYPETQAYVNAVLDRLADTRTYGKGHP
jgi:soluble lytic murein transglycosylase-like protein